MTSTLAIPAELPRSVGYRTAVFAFGVIAYVLSVGALLTLILILLGLLSFSGGPIGELDFGVALALDFVLLLVFGLQHSLMARLRFKARWTQLVPPAAERSVYLFATALALLPLITIWQPMPERVWSVEEPMLRWLLVAAAIAGWVYLFVASFAINHFELFGLQQVYRALHNRTPSPPPFRTRWMYRFDRHPIMTGFLIGLWVTPAMTLDRLLFATGTTIYICIGVHFEERSLRRQLGRQYDEYRRRVGTIVPTL